jgi:hypothetical protein
MLLATSVGTGRSALQTYGSAGEKTCADWNSATQAGNDDARVMQSWVLGYVSGGLMVYAQDPNAVPRPPMGVEEIPGSLEGGQLISTPSVRTLAWDTPGLVELANRQCASVPNQSLSTVAANIMNRLMRRGR